MRDALTPVSTACRLPSGLTIRAGDLLRQADGRVFEVVLASPEQVRITLTAEPEGQRVAYPLTRNELARGRYVHFTPTGPTR